MDPKNKGPIVTLLLMMAVLLILMIYLLVNTGLSKEENSCKEIQELNFLSSGTCYTETETKFSIINYDEDITGYSLEFKSNELVEKVKINSGEMHPLISQGNNNFGKKILIKKGIQDFSFSKSANFLEISPIVAGETCNLKKSIVIPKCDANISFDFLGNDISDGEPRRRDDDGGSGSGGGGGGGEPEEFSISLTSPSEGEAFNFTENILLEFTIEGDAESCWYELDDSAQIEIPDCQNTAFSTDEGTHFIEVFASNAEGDIVSDSANFIVDLEAGEICSGAGASQLILKLSHPTNAHAQFWNQLSYGVEVCYNEIFGEEFESDNARACTGTNEVLSLSHLTNAHAETSQQNNYQNDICFGNLVCRSTTETCSPNEKKIVGLSHLTNAHLEIPSLNNYPVSVCCSAI